MRTTSARRWLPGLITLCTLATPPVAALTTDGFFRICEMGGVPCSENQLLQAYIGGALDVTASLSESTDYLETIYCTDPKTLFQIPAIVAYMEEHREEFAQRNAMVLLIRYLVEHGEC